MMEHHQPHSCAIAAESPGGGLNLSTVTNAWNNISAGGKLFLTSAVGAACLSSQEKNAEFNPFRSLVLPRN